MTPDDRYNAMEEYIARIEAKYTLYMMHDYDYWDGGAPRVDYEVNGRRIADFQRYAMTGDTSFLPEDLAPMFEAVEAGVPMADILA